MSQPKDPVPEPSKKPSKPRAWGTAPQPRQDTPKVSGWGRQPQARKASVNAKGWGKTPTTRRDVRTSSSKWGTQADVLEKGPHRAKWGLLIALCAAAVLGWVGWQKGVPLVEQRYFIGKTRECIARKDEGGLQVLLAKVLAINQDNADACRLVAETLTLRGDPQVIHWRSRVADLAPGNLDDQLALAEALLRFDRVADADKVLASIRDKGSARFRYQNLAGIVAERMGRGALADFHFTKAAILDPQDAIVPLRLAIVRLQSPELSARQAARSALEKLAATPESKIVAIRALILDALQENRAGRALSLAEALQASKGSAFVDRLLFLKILQMTGSPDFGPSLAETQESAAKHPRELAELLGWMNANDLALFAAHWMRNLPLEFELPSAVQFRNAESYARMGDWAGLVTLITNSDWENLEFLRNALLARGFESVGDFVDAHSKWDAAVAAVPDGGEELELLVSMAQQWGWKEQAAAALWQLTQKSSNPVRALTRLYKAYLEDRDTQGLYRVLTEIVKLQPANFPARNNLNLVSLLLGRDKARALDFSQALYLKTPENPAYTSTYAYALYCDGKAAKGLEVMESLTQQQRQDPSVATYYCVLLAANGRFSETGNYLPIALNARLLPEEQQLLRDFVGEDKQGTAP